MNVEPLTSDALKTRASAEAGKLRVALFSGNYNYVVDGALLAQNKLVEHLLKRGHEVLVFSPTSKSPAFDHVGELVPIPSFALPGSRSEYRLGLGLFGAAKARLDAFRPTLIHLAAPDITGFQSVNYGQKNGIPVVASFHTRFDTYPRYYGAAWAEKYLTNYMRHVYGRCEHVYPPAESMKEELVRVGIGREVRLWARGVDHEVFTPKRRDLEWRRSLGILDGDLLVSFVGRIVLEKGIDVFAEAINAARAKAGNVKAIVVGDGPEADRFSKALPDSVFTGFLAGEQLARAYASADVFLNPSITESFGNVTLEAMACGSPVIGANASGSVSIIVDNQNGLLVDPQEGAAGFSEAVVRVANDRELLKTLGAEAHKTGLTYNWETILDRLINDYRDAIAGYRTADAA